MTTTSATTVTTTRPALSQVRIDDPFWSPRIRTVRETTLAAQLQQFETVGHFEALSLNWTRTNAQPHIFWDSDVAKWIEAASYQLEIEWDAELDATLDEVIERVAGAQQPDGYLNSYYSNVAPDRRFTDLRDAHELYCAGHLIEAAVAHFQATGKASLLGVMRRYADLIAATFGRGEGQTRGYDGHEEIELALVKLHAVTGEQRYLDLARYFVDERGREPYFFDLEAERRGDDGWFAREFPERNTQRHASREYLQAHLPVVEQTEAVGHAVRDMYLFSAVTDIAALDDDAALATSARTVWNHLTSRRMYVTGGIGSSARNEGFTRDFDLPDLNAYSETCAAIGLMFWASRMADLDDDARYIDVLERALYNNVLAGADAGGTCFFYDNPLASHGDHHRAEWFGVACCPPNLARLLSSLGHYIYARTDEGVRVDLYIGSEVTFCAGDHQVRISQRTSLPWASDVTITVGLTPEEHDFELALRIPEWAIGATIAVNGTPVDVDVVTTRGYARIRRAWSDGDEVQLNLPVTPRRVWAHPEIDSAAGRVSIARGPFVYCAEGVDNAFPLDQASVGSSASLRDAPVREDGVVPVVVPGLRDVPAGGGLYAAHRPTADPVDLVTVPYYSWDNREPGEMRVWLREAVDR